MCAPLVAARQPKSSLLRERSNSSVQYNGLLLRALLHEDSLEDNQLVFVEVQVLSVESTAGLVGRFLVLDTQDELVLGSGFGILVPDGLDAGDLDEMSARTGDHGDIVRTRLPLSQRKWCSWRVALGETSCMSTAIQ